MSSTCCRGEKAQRAAEGNRGMVQVRGGLHLARLLAADLTCCRPDPVTSGTASSLQATGQAPRVYCPMLSII